MPMLYTLFQMATRRDPEKSQANSNYRLHSYGDRDRDTGKRQRKYQHPLSMPNDTAMGSDERIVLPSDLTKRPHAIPTAGAERDEIGSRDIKIHTDLRVESADKSPGREDRNNHYEFPEQRVPNYHSRSYV